MRLTYPEQAGALPGRNSLERVDGLVPEASRLVGEPFRLLDPPQSHAKCRITLASDEGGAQVHVDQSHWSGILYLSLPRHSTNDEARELAMRVPMRFNRLVCDRLENGRLVYQMSSARHKRRSNRGRDSRNHHVHAGAYTDSRRDSRAAFNVWLGRIAALTLSVSGR